MNKQIWIEQTDCIDFLKKLPNASVDLILTDPPFGINEKKFQNHYNRKKELVLDGYQEAPLDISYEDWVYSWAKEFDRVLKPDGSILIISGWTNEADIQYAIRRTKKFKMINHLIWHYNFGVYTKNKFVSSHYHILYYARNNGKPYFNRNAFYHDHDRNQSGGSQVYQDLQDVISIKREYHHHQIKNCNRLPTKLVEKLIQHTTKKNDVILDLFGGSFTIAKTALKLGRSAWSCEINPTIYNHFIKLII